MTNRMSSGATVSAASSTNTPRPDRVTGVVGTHRIAAALNEVGRQRRPDGRPKWCGGSHADMLPKESKADALANIEVLPRRSVGLDDDPIRRNPFSTRGTT